MLITEKGTIYQICPVEEGVSKSGRQWASQRLWVEIQTTYNTLSRICVKVRQALLEQVAQMKVGDRVTVQYIIDCREYNDKVFTELILMHIDKEVLAAPAPNTAAPQPGSIFPKGYTPRESPKPQFNEKGESVDLPF